MGVVMSHARPMLRVMSGDPPIIFGERTVDLPAAAGDGALVRLVVNGQAGDPEQEIGLRIARMVEGAAAGKVTGDADDPEAILESLGAHVHLIAAKSMPNLKSCLWWM
jgi:hypothetical protein